MFGILFWRARSLRKGGLFMYRVSVESTTLSWISHDRGRRLLELEFANASVYRNLDVPAAVHAELLAAPSKGRFFHQRVR